MSYIKKEELVRRCEEKFADYRNRRPYRPLCFVDENNIMHYNFLDKFSMKILKSLLECKDVNIITLGESCVLNKANEAYLCNIKGEGNKSFVFTGLARHIEGSDIAELCYCLDDNSNLKLVSRDDIVRITYNNWVITKC